MSAIFAYVTHDRFRATLSIMANERARSLRRDMSPPERSLWRALRGGQIDGFRFRRQHPIGAFVVDFFCLEKRLVSEVDGRQHGEAAQAAHDDERTRWLQARGYRVVRFWSNEVTSNMPGVLAAVSFHLSELPSRAGRPPPPRRTENHLATAVGIAQSPDPDPGAK